MLFRTALVSPRRGGCWILAMLTLMAACSNGASRAAQDPTARVTVDLSRPVANSRSMAGFLHGMDAASPPDSVIRPLRPALWRGTPSSAPYDRARSYGAQYVVVLSDLWGYPSSGSLHGAPYDHLKAWAQLVRDAAASFRGQDVIFEVWNEPNSPAFWQGTEEQLFKTYVTAAQALQSAWGPSVRIASPSLGWYSSVFISRFLQGCLKARGCRVTSLAWHEFPGPNPPISSIVTHLRDARRRYLNTSKFAQLGVRDLYVTEAVNDYSQYRPGETLAYLWALEQGGADGAAHACWNDPRGNSQCFNHTLDGLVTPDRFEPLPPWWTYKLYADGVSTRVEAASKSDSLVALASTGSAEGVDAPQILLGRAASASTPERAAVTVDLRGLEALPSYEHAGSVALTVQRVPDQGDKPLSRPKSVAAYVIEVQNGVARIRIPRVSLHDMYAIFVNPVGGSG